MKTEVLFIARENKAFQTKKKGDDKKQEKTTSKEEAFYFQWMILDSMN